MTTIGEKITSLRKEKNMTQSELGEALCVSPQAVSKWERDQAQPDIDTLVRMATLFGVSMDELLKGTPAPAPEKEIKEGAQETSAATAADIKAAVPVGMCMSCGHTLYEGDVGESKPVLLCKNCATQKKLRLQKQKDDAAKAAAAAKEAERHKKRLAEDDERRERRRGFIWGAIAGVAALIILLIAVPRDDVGSYIAIVVCGTYAVFATVAQCLWDSYLTDVFLWFIERTIRFPGVIFSFDLDGFIFLIAMKLLFAAIGFLFGLFMAIIGVFITLFLGFFSFPFALIRKNREIREAGM